MKLCTVNHKPSYNFFDSVYRRKPGKTHKFTVRNPHNVFTVVTEKKILNYLACLPQLNTIA